MSVFHTKQKHAMGLQPFIVMNVYLWNVYPNIYLYFLSLVVNSTYLLRFKTFGIDTCDFNQENLSLSLSAKWACANLIFGRASDYPLSHRQTKGIIACEVCGFPV